MRIADGMDEETNRMVGMAVVRGTADWQQECGNVIVSVCATGDYFMWVVAGATQFYNWLSNSNLEHWLVSRHPYGYGTRRYCISVGQAMPWSRSVEAGGCISRCTHHRWFIIAWTALIKMRINTHLTASSLHPFMYLVSLSAIAWIPLNINTNKIIWCLKCDSLQRLLIQWLR